MRTQTKRIPFIFLVVAITLVFSMALSTETSAAKTKKMKLPTKITCYAYTGGKWTAQNTLTYSYNSKGDVISGSDKDYHFKVSYKYKKGKKTKATVTGNGIAGTFTFDKKGRIKKIRFSDGYSYVYRYGKKNKWYSFGEKGGEYDKYVFSYKKKALVKAKIYTEEGYSETLHYKNNLLTRFGIRETVTYKMSGAYVSTMFTKNDSGKKYKFVYQYGNAKAPKSRYYKIINGDERAMIPVLIDSPHTRTLLDEL